MVLLYENDPLDSEEARGHFYHVCLGRIDRNELEIPSDDQPYECPRCGVDLERGRFLGRTAEGIGVDSAAYRFRL